MEGMRGAEGIAGERLFCSVKKQRCFDGVGRRALTFLRRDLKSLVDNVFGDWEICRNEEWVGEKNP